MPPTDVFRSTPSPKERTVRIDDTWQLDWNESHGMYMVGHRHKAIGMPGSSVFACINKKSLPFDSKEDPITCAKCDAKVPDAIVFFAQTKGMSID